jgi:hypothetical protein
VTWDARTVTFSINFKLNLFIYKVVIKGIIKFMPFISSLAKSISSFGIIVIKEKNKAN